MLPWFEIEVYTFLCYPVEEDKKWWMNKKAWQHAADDEDGLFFAE